MCYYIILTKDSVIDLNIERTTPFKGTTESGTTGVGVAAETFLLPNNVGCGILVPAGIKFKYSRTSPLRTRPYLPVAGTFFKSTCKYEFVCYKRIFFVLSRLVYLNKYNTQQFTTKN
jgi:hypothetical protein